MAIILFPTMERPGEESGEDSDDEDSPEAAMNKLPRSIMESEAEIRNNEIVGVDEEGVIRALNTKEGTGDTS